MSKNEVCAYVIRLPDDPEARTLVQQALDTLKPYATGMSLEDEMTVLDLIEQHPDFDTSIADEARKQAKAMTQEAKEPA